VNRSPLFEPESLNKDKGLCSERVIYNLDCKALAGKTRPVEVEVCDEEKAAFSCWSAYVVKKCRKNMRPDRDDSWKP
jgi:hypothetical protein